VLLHPVQLRQLHHCQTVQAAGQEQQRQLQQRQVLSFACRNRSK
jgi:hypothetical protein